MVEKLYEKIIRWRTLLIVGILLLTGFFAFQSLSLVLYEDPSMWPPKYNPNVKLNEVMQKQFGGANMVTVQVTVKEGDIFNYQTLSKVKRITDAIELIWGNIPYNLLSIAANRVRYLEPTDEILISEPLMETVPGSPEGIKRLRYGIDHNPLVLGRLVSMDYKSSLIIADFRTIKASSGGFELPSTDPVKIYKDITKIITPENDENHVVRCVGTPIIIGWVNSEGLKYVLGAFIIFVIGVIIVLFISLRRVAPVIISFIAGIITSIWAFGLFRLIFGNVLTSSSAFIAPFIIVAAVTCHAVQFFRRFIGEEYTLGVNADVALRKTVFALSKPIFISLLVDCTSFIVLAFVPFDNVCVLGRVTVLGFLSALLCIYLFLVPVSSLCPGQPQEKAIEKSGGRGRLERLIDEGVRGLIMPGKARWVVLGCVAFLFLVSVSFLPWIKTGQDNTYAIHNYLTKSWKRNPIYLMEVEFKEKFKGIYPLSILIETKEPNGLIEPNNMKKIDKFSAFMSGVPQVAGCSEFVGIFKLLNWFNNGGNKDFFVIPEDRRAIAFCYDILALSEPGAADGILDEDVKKTAFYVYVGDTSYGTVESVFSAAQEYAQKHFNDDSITASVGAGSIGIAKAFNDNIRVWLILTTILAALASYIVMLIILRSWTAGLFLLLPMFVGTMIFLLIVEVLGIEINSNTTTAMAISMGVAIDAEIYFLYRFREEYRRHKDFYQGLLEGFTTIRKALVFSHLSLVVGLWMLIPIPLYIGYVGFGMGLIILVCFVVSFIISPILWSAFKPKFLFGNGQIFLNEDFTKHSKENSIGGKDYSQKLKV